MILLCGGTANAYAQTYRVGTFFTKEAVPYSLLSPVSGSLHPGGTLSVGKAMKTAEGPWQQWLYVDLGGYHHAEFQTSAYVQGRWQWERTLPHGFTWAAGAGAGYQHVFFPNGSFTLNEETGVLEPQGSKPTATAHVSTSLGWSPPTLPDWQVTAQFQGWVEGPFAPAFGVPVFPHTYAQIGITKTFSRHGN